MSSFASSVPLKRKDDLDKAITTVVDNVTRIVGGSITLERSDMNGDVIQMTWTKRSSNDKEDGRIFATYKFAIFEFTEAKDLSALSNTILEAIFRRFPEQRAFQNSRNVTISPSRTYVAVCLSLTGGYYFKKFLLPERSVINNTEEAAWYFLNKIDYTAVINGCFTYEDYQKLSEVNTY